MSTVVGGNILWNLVVQSDFITQMIMLGLLGMSIACWAVAIYKIVFLRIKLQQTKYFNQQIEQMSNMHSIVQCAQEYKNSLPGYVALQVIAAHKPMMNIQDAALLMQDRSDAVLDDVMHYEESYVPLLSISASTATLLGLFGTVWGLIHAFVRISEQQSADIVAVAPGISEALITTIAGLFVAIPALIFSQYINVRIRQLDFNLSQIVHHIMVVAKVSSQPIIVNETIVPSVKHENIQQ